MDPDDDNVQGLFADLGLHPIEANTNIKWDATGQGQGQGQGQVDGTWATVLKQIMEAMPKGDLALKQLEIRNTTNGTSEMVVVYSTSETTKTKSISLGAILTSSAVSIIMAMFLTYFATHMVAALTSGSTKRVEVTLNTCNRIASACAKKIEGR